MPTSRASKKPSLRQLVLTSLYIGVTGYGGPAIIAQIKRIYVERGQWVDERLFLTGLSLSQMLPGATSMNLLEFLSCQVYGGWAALLTPMLMIAPAFFLMTALSAVYFAFGNIPLVQALFTGLGAVVVALLLNATYSLGRSALKDFWSVLIAILAFTLRQFLHLHVLLVAAAAAGAGLALYYGRITPHDAAPHHKSVAVNGKSVFTGRRLFRFCLAAIALFSLVIVWVVYRKSLGVEVFSALTRVGLLTFGGGYAAVPLFQHEAVSAHHWLTVRQFLDGIALGQITPGPVLITSAFIGYHLLGIPGAFLGTLAIFAPSCSLMFVLARKHDMITKAAWAQGMIGGVVAGYIGILAGVIIYLAGNSLTDWRTTALFLAALPVLILWKKDPLWVILGGAALSLIFFHH